MSKLTVLRGHDTGRQILVTEDAPVSIGRGVDCSFQLHDPSVSRIHCHINKLEGSLLLSDAGSRWGVQVNGRVVNEVTLRDQDRISIGETEILVELYAGHAGTTLAPALREEQTVEPRFSPGNASLPDEKFASPKTRQIESEDAILQLAGNRFLRFEVQALLAAARTGAIFRAWDPKHGRDVALKLFWQHLFADESQLRRFTRAMRTAIPIRHENLVRIYTAGRVRGVCFTSCELVEGESADQLIQRVGVCGMLDWRRVLRISIQLAQALQAAAKRNMVHRNITPHNILIRASDDTVKLNDLVFAKAIAGTRVEHVTTSGQLVGELEYMSPEQTGVDRPLDGRSDIYSLGATLYALVTGRPPFEGRNPAETIHKIQCETPAPPTTYHLSISPLFEGEVMRMLEKRPEDRHPSPTALLKDFQRVAKYENVES